MHNPQCVRIRGAKLNFWSDLLGGVKIIVTITWHKMPQIQEVEPEEGQLSMSLGPSIA